MVVERATKELPLRYEVEGQSEPVERRFVLKEMFDAQLRRWMALREKVEDDAVDELEHHPGQAKMVDAADLVIGGMGAVLLEALSYPADGAGPFPAEHLPSLTYSMRRAIIAGQDEVNQLQALLGNSSSLLARAAARRQAQKILDAADPSMDGSPGKSATSSEPATEPPQD